MIFKIADMREYTQSDYIRPPAQVFEAVILSIYIYYIYLYLFIVLARQFYTSQKSI